MSDGPWKQKFDARCRRLLGVTDDTKGVHIYTNSGDLGGCDTCGYGADEPVEVSCAGKTKMFGGVAELVNALDAVEL